MTMAWDRSATTRGPLLLLGNAIILATKDSLVRQHPCSLKRIIEVSETRKPHFKKLYSH